MHGSRQALRVDTHNICKSLYNRLGDVIGSRFRRTFFSESTETRCFYIFNDNQTLSLPLQHSAQQPLRLDPQSYAILRDFSYEQAYVVEGLGVKSVEHNSYPQNERLQSSRLYSNPSRDREDQWFL